MSMEWRPALLALRSIQRVPARYLPLLGILVGAIGGGIYWLAAQLWPTSVAVVLAMLATVLTAASSSQSSAKGPGPIYWVFVLLIKYSALMALSAARAPFPLPENLTLGLIMVAGHATSRALLVSVMATHARAATRVTATDLGVALGLGLAPAALLGIPGLIGLAAAIVMRLVLGAYAFPKLTGEFPERLDVTQQLTETCFYLGALATWKYV